LTDGESGFGAERMNAVLLQDFPWELNDKLLLEKFRLPGESSRADALRRVAAEAEARGRPRAFYRRCWIESRGQEHVNLEGVSLHSRVMTVNLEKAHSAFPFVATCGPELEEWSRSLTGALEKYWAEEIKGLAVGAAVLATAADVQEHHCPGRLAMMNPGSLDDWPLSGQAPLFALLEQPGKTMEAVLGVRLLPSGLMDPGMTVSGIWFPAEEAFENCMLCPREACPGRRAPHDPELYDKKFRAPGQLP